MSVKRKSFRQRCNEMMALDNVIGVGKGHKRIDGKPTEEEGIIVLVKEKLPMQSIRPQHVIPKNIDGVVTDVVEVGEIRLLNGRTANKRPAQPGMSIGHYRISAGTFGAVVKDRRTGTRFILSNNHVLANSSDATDNRAKIGDIILQPGAYDGGITNKDVIGRLERFIPMVRTTTKSQCSVALLVQNLFNVILKITKPDYQMVFLHTNSNAGNLVDCALAKPEKDDMISSEILDIGKVKGITDAKVGMKVRKSGRTSGVSSSEVVATDVSLSVDLGDAGSALFIDQIITSNMSKPGDSGSLVLDDNNNAIGLLFAGSDKATVCNRIQNVLRVLDVTLEE